MATLSLSITIPDDKLDSVIDALAYQTGYTDLVPGQGDDRPLYEQIESPLLVPNPATKQQWVRSWMLSVIKATYKSYKNKEATSIALDNQKEDGGDFT